MNKALIIAIVASLATGFACGKYTKNDKVTEVTKTTTTDNKNNNVSTETVKDTNKVTVITENKDGTKTITITDKSTIDTHTKDKSTESSKTNTDTYKEVLNNTSRLNISLLAGVPFPLNTSQPYNLGISLNKQVLGPFTIGVWAFAIGQKSAGFSLGVNL